MSGKCLNGMDAEAREEGAGDGVGAGKPIPKKPPLLPLAPLLGKVPSRAMGSM